MRNDLIWADVTYKLHYLDKTFKKEINKRCFSFYLDLDKNDLDKIEYIEYNNIRCAVTNKYYDFYLNYLIDMFKLEAEILDNGIKFKSYSCKYKNLLVLTCIRFLYERIGYLDTKTSKKVLLHFFESLKSGKCKYYRNKLKRFCYFYKQLRDCYKGNFWHTGHSWDPSTTDIKSTEDFIKTKKLNSVNSFFENKNLNYE